MKKSTQKCIEKFVECVSRKSPRFLSFYEKNTIAYALYSILRDYESSWEDTVTRTGEAIYEFEQCGDDNLELGFIIVEDEVFSCLGVDNLFSLAKSTSEFIFSNRPNNRNQLYTSTDSIYLIYFELINLFSEWESEYDIDF